MLVGVPREVKNHEYRVAITPAGVHELTRHGHEVVIEHGAGVGSSITDDEYVAAGAKILDTADEVWADRRAGAQGQGADRRGVRPHARRARRCSPTSTSPPSRAVHRRAAVGGHDRDRVRDRAAARPLAAAARARCPRSPGRLAPQVGAYHLMRSGGGRGVLPGGVPGVHPAEVVVIGGGVSGVNAAQVAHRHGRRRRRSSTSTSPRLRQVDAQFGGAITTVASNAYAIEQAVRRGRPRHRRGAGARRQGAEARQQRAGRHDAPGSVLVDIAIDQGGCFETRTPRRTTTRRSRCTTRCSTASPTCPARCRTPRRTR